MLLKREWGKTYRQRITKGLVVFVLGDKWTVRMLSFSETDCLFVPLHFLKIQWEGNGDTDPRIDMKYHLSTLH